MSRSWSHYLSTLVDLILPHSCLVCHRSGTYLCPTCARVLPPAPPTPSPALSALWHYEHPAARRLVQKLKYGGSYTIAQDLGAILYCHWREQNKDDTNHWLVSGTPLSRERMRERKYNQSAELAKMMTACNPRQLEYRDDLLLKIRHTVAQVKTGTREERLENLRDAFSVPRPEQVRGRNILIIDDVITTGATLNECGCVLLLAGAGQVRGLALAHG